MNTNILLKINYHFNYYILHYKKIKSYHIIYVNNIITLSKFHTFLTESIEISDTNVFKMINNNHASIILKIHTSHKDMHKLNIHPCTNFIFIIHEIVF